MMTDPVCGMRLDEHMELQMLTFDGEAYYFCSEACRAEFQRHPEDYLRKTENKESATDV